MNSVFWIPPSHFRPGLILHLCYIQKCKTVFLIHLGTSKCQDGIIFSKKNGKEKPAIIGNILL